MSEVDALLTRACESLRAAQIMIREDLANIAASRAYMPYSMLRKRFY
jgi:uncharacterized protein (UPF0332 family)